VSGVLQAAGFKSSDISFSTRCRFHDGSLTFIFIEADQDIDNLKQRLISVWALLLFFLSEFKQSVIDKAIDQWRPEGMCSCQWTAL